MSKVGPFNTFLLQHQSNAAVSFHVCQVVTGKKIFHAENKAED